MHVQNWDLVIQSNHDHLATITFSLIWVRLKIKNSQMALILDLTQHPELTFTTHSSSRRQILQITENIHTSFDADSIDSKEYWMRKGATLGTDRDRWTD